MTESTSSSAPDQYPPAPTRPVVRQRPRISIVWIIPIVAALIGAYLLWHWWSSKGPTIDISFPVASGIEAGKTPIKYRDVQVGMVKTVQLSDALDHVIVTAELDKYMSQHLRESTAFWVVQPRLTAQGVSGLGTLFSGSYIGMRPGREGREERKFVGLDQPPVLELDTPGIHFSLRSDKLGSIALGSPIYYRGVQVGLVLGSELDKDFGGVTFFAFVSKPYDSLVREKTRFWNASGIGVSVGAGGVNVQMESLTALLSGGVAFDNPPDLPNDPVAQDGASYPLFASYDDIRQAEFTLKVPYVAYFDGSVRGLQPGAPLEFRGIRVGSVRSVKMVFDSNLRPRIPVTIDMEPQRILMEGIPPGLKPYEVMEAMVKRGLRAQLQSANLLTGELLIALVEQPNAPPATLKMGGEYPEIPTVPSDIEALSEKAKVFLDKVARLPLPQLIEEVRTTIRSTDTLIAKQAGPAVQDLAPLIDSLKKTSAAAKLALEQADLTLKTAGTTLQSTNALIGDDSRVRFQLLQMLEELTSAARSLRALSSNLERQPQSIIFGKEPASKP